MHERIETCLGLCCSLHVQERNPSMTAGNAGAYFCSEIPSLCLLLKSPNAIILYNHRSRCSRENVRVESACRCAMWWPSSEMTRDICKQSTTTWSNPSAGLASSLSPHSHARQVVQACLRILCRPSGPFGPLISRQYYIKLGNAMLRRVCDIFLAILPRT